MRHFIAIDDADRDKPIAIQMPQDRHPIELDIAFIERRISAQPTFLNARVPTEIAVLGIDEMLCQSLCRPASELQFEPGNQGFHHAI